MELSRAVMDDLMVLYLSGEAGPETTQLVLAYAAQHQDYADLLGGAKTSLTTTTSAGPHPDLEMKGLQMTKQNISQSKLAMGMGIFFSMAPFSLYVKQDHLEFMLLRDLPMLAYLCWAIAALCWLGYFRLATQLKRNFARKN